MLPLTRQFGVWWVVALAVAGPIGAAEKAPARVEPVTPELVARLNLDPFYRRHLSAGGLPIISSPLVGDGPFLEAARIMDGFFAGREDVRAELSKLGIRVVILAADEDSAHLPEFARFGADAAQFNVARGYGPTPDCRLIVCCEENLAGRDGDWYVGESVLVHELGHAVQAALQA